MNSPIRPLPLSGGFLAAALALVAPMSAQAGGPAAPGPYHYLTSIPVGTAGGWDYLSIDPAIHRLFVAHATRVVVIDTLSARIVVTIAAPPGVHGVAVAPGLGLGFVSDGQAGQVSIVDLATLKTVGRVPAGGNPDCIQYEAGRNEVYAFNGRSDSATVIAADTAQVKATIPLGGRPEFAQPDPAAGRVYDNLEDKSKVIAIDTATHAVIARWPLAPGEGPSGLALDAAHHRLFVGCHNRLMVILDSTDGRVVATEPIGEGVDATAFDPGTGYAFSSNGRSAAVTIVHEDSPDKFTVVQNLPTAPGARTMQVDPVSHKIYLATAKFEPPKPGQQVHGWRRPRFVPGSFEILVYGLAP